jgi:hypothetical protein
VHFGPPGFGRNLNLGPKRLLQEEPPEGQKRRFLQFLYSTHLSNRHFLCFLLFSFLALLRNRHTYRPRGGKKEMFLKIQNLRSLSPPLRNRHFARDAARAARSAPSLFRRAGEMRRAENDVRRHAPFLRISIRFSTFPLRGLLARRLASRRVVVVREMRFNEASATSGTQTIQVRSYLRFINQAFHLISSNLSIYKDPSGPHRCVCFRTPPEKTLFERKPLFALRLRLATKGPFFLEFTLSWIS